MRVSQKAVYRGDVSLGQKGADMGGGYTGIVHQQIRHYSIGNVSFLAEGRQLFGCARAAFAKAEIKSADKACRALS